MYIPLKPYFKDIYCVIYLISHSEKVLGVGTSQLYDLGRSNVIIMYMNVVTLFSMIIT